METDSYKNIEEQKLKKIAVGLAVILIIGLAIFGIVQFVKSLQNPYGKSITIEGISNQINNLSKDQIDNIEHQLYVLAEANSNNDQNIGENTATIRESTISIEKNGNGFYDRFVVDLEKIRQSYLVQVDLAEGGMSGYPVFVSCVPEDEIIYSDFNCRDGEALFIENLPPYAKLMDYIPYSGKLKNGEQFIVKDIIDNNENDGTIEVKVNNCGREDIIAETRTAVSEWMESKGFDAAKYKIEIPLWYENCLIN